MSDRNVFSSNEVILGRPRNSWSQERAALDEKLGTFVPILQSQGKREGLEIELIIDHTYVMKPLLKKSLNYDVQGASRLVNTSNMP